MDLSEHVRRWVREDFDVVLNAMTPVRHGADRAAEVWKASCSSGTQYAVKFSAGGSSAGLVVPDALAEFGIAGVVPPQPTRTGRLWSERDGRRLSLARWVSDASALEVGMAAQHWRSYGDLLARVHEATVTEELQAVVPKEGAYGRWAPMARALFAQLVGGASTEPGQPIDHLSQAVASEWRAAAHTISDLLDLVDTLHRELRERWAPTVLCHGDAHLGNVLVSGDELWLVDWDDAARAPREHDLMFVLDGVLFFAPVSSQEQAWFFEGYGDVDVDPARLAYDRCVRALEDLADPTNQILDVAGNSEHERTEALSILRGVLSPSGLVSVATRYAGKGTEQPVRHP